MAAIGIATVAGCETTEVEFLETKQIDERLTEPDVRSVVAVLEAVSEKERSRLPSPFLPPPIWSESRTLPVSELMSAERDAFERVWQPEQIADRIPKGEPWDSAFKSRRLTREQFCALMLSVTAALGRAATDDKISLRELAKRGERELASLTNDERPFSSLTSNERHEILNQAAWFAIRDRARHLDLVPEENVELVIANQEVLRKVLGDELFANPLTGLYPRPEDFGVPFEEGELSDATLTWSPGDAIVGPDASRGEGGEPTSRTPRTIGRW